MIIVFLIALLCLLDEEGVYISPAVCCAVLSIAISALATGYTSAIVSYNDGESQSYLSLYLSLSLSFLRLSSVVLSMLVSSSLFISRSTLPLYIAHSHFARALSLSLSLSPSLSLADVDPQKRKDSPDFYGYLPDKPLNRSLIFLCMVANGSLVLLMRSIALALLIAVDASYALYYVSGDVLVYCAQKVARKDWVYFVATEGRVSSFVVPALRRVSAKLITDVTGMVQYRHANELGGLYWLLNVFLSILSPFAAATVYCSSRRQEKAGGGEGGSGGGGGEGEGEGEGGSGGSNSELIWKLLTSLSQTWVVAFALFLLLVKGGYRSTFFSPATGRRRKCAAFLKATDDRARSRVFEANQEQWKGIREQVKVWVFANYWSWVEEKPAWFNAALIRSIPRDMVPADSSFSERDALSDERDSSVRLAEDEKRRLDLRQDLGTGMPGRGQGRA